jgi:hypothetical protein
VFRWRLARVDKVGQGERERKDKINQPLSAQKLPKSVVPCSVTTYVTNFSCDNFSCDNYTTTTTGASASHYQEVVPGVGQRLLHGPQVHGMSDDVQIVGGHSFKKRERIGKKRKRRRRSQNVAKVG